MMCEKLLTIVVPTYNTQDLLPRCLDSLLVDGELFSKIEILVVIDGSPDNSVSVAKQYSEKWPQTFYTVEKENGGHGSTINKGLALARGKYFKVLDSDDWFDTTEFSSFLRVLSNIDVDIVLTDYVKEFVSNNSQEFMTLNLVKGEVLCLDKIDLKEDSRLLFAMARACFKTELLRISKVFLLEKTFYVDTILSFSPIYKASSMIYVGHNLYRYFIGREDQSVSQASMLRNKTHLERVIQYLWVEYLEKGGAISDSKREYFILFFESLVVERFIILNNLPYRSAKKELAEWDVYRKSMRLSTKNKIISLYTLLPFGMWRWLMNSFFVK